MTRSGQNGDGARRPAARPAGGRAFRRVPGLAALLGAGAWLLLGACSPDGGGAPREAVAAESAAPGTRFPQERSTGAPSPEMARELALLGPGQGAGTTAGEGGAGPGERPREAAQTLDGSRRTAIVRASNRVAPAVVTVNVIRTQRVQPRGFFDFFGPQLRRAAGFGSGFIIDAEGIVLTNEHVVRGADRVMVTLSDGRDFEASLVGVDEVVDVAVLRIDGSDLPVAPLGTSENLIIGEWVLAIGNPFGTMVSSTEPTVTAGVVSAVERHIVPDGNDQERGFYLGMIQTDAAINPGNSGGPLVNALGQVVGINASIFSRSGGSEGLGFAIPVDRALKVADDLLRFGEIRRAWLGFDVEPVEADAWGRTRGVRISRVAPGSPAAAAGIAEGTRLLEANGRRLTAPLDFEDVLLDLRAGDEIQIRLEDRTAAVTLRATALPSVQAERVTALGDLDVITVTPEVRAERNLTSESGALVVSISPELRSQLGFQPGDVIIRVNNTPIETADDLAAFFDRISGARGRVEIYFERRGGLVRRSFIWGG